MALSTGGFTMPSCAVRTFSDPDAYAAAIRQSTVQLTVTGRGHFTAQIVRIDLHHLWMQRLADSLPRITHTDSSGGRAVISFRMQPGPSLTWGGVDLRPGQIIRHKVGGSSHQHASGGTGIGAMSLPLEDMAAVGAVIAGCELTAPSDALIVTPPPAAMAKLLRLHAAAGQLAEAAPEVIGHPEAARGLEQSLIEALVGCIAVAEAQEDRAAQRRHALITHRFHKMVEENPDSALYVPEICAAIDVSPRTLLACCQEHLGMGPKRYLMLRRMSLVRRALRQATPGTTTVTNIASQYGSWEFGRFAGVYKSTFGETPSETLRCIAR
jgi:AraC-like DNA-binding protein